MNGVNKRRGKEGTGKEGRGKGVREEGKCNDNKEER